MFKGGRLSFINQERKPLIGKSSVLPPRISPSRSGMGLTARSSRLHRDPSRALSINSHSMYNESTRGYNMTKMSNYESENRHYQSFEGATTKHQWKKLYHKRKDSITLLKKGSGTGGGKLQPYDYDPNMSQEEQSPQEAHYNSITLHNTSLIQDPVIAKIESKIYRGTYKDPLKKEEVPQPIEGQVKQAQDENEKKEEDPQALHLQSIQTTTSTRKKPTASPFPGFYGEKPAPVKKNKKNQGTGKLVPIEKMNNLEKYMMRFKKILLKHKHSPERLKGKQKNQRKVSKYYNEQFLTKIILDSQFQDILHELNLFTNIERDEDLVKKVLEEVHLRREILIEEEYKKIEENKQELFRLQAIEEEKLKNNAIRIQESIGKPSPSRLTQEVLSHSTSRRDQKSSRMDSRIMTPRSQRSSSKRSARAASQSKPVQSQFANQTQPRPQSTLRSSPEVQEQEDPEETELKPQDWKQIGKNKNLQFAVLDRIMMECEEIESPPESYETQAGLILRQIKDNKWKCDLMIKDISWSIECLFDILSGTITENANLFNLRKEKGRNEWRNWVNFLNQDMIQDMNEEKWSQTFFVSKLGTQRVWKSKARLFGRKFEKQNPTFGRLIKN